MDLIKNLIVKGTYLSFAMMVLMGGGLVHAEEEVPNIVVTKAWVRAMPPVQKNTGAYMTIENTTDHAFLLKAASTSAAGEVQTHEMQHVDGMMKMRKVDGISIPAHSHVALQPGGLHLMLLRLTQPLNVGDEIPIVLTFQDSIQWTCPMHSEVHQEEQGECPQCGMSLEPATVALTVQAKVQEEAMEHTMMEHAHHE